MSENTLITSYTPSRSLSHSQYTPSSTTDYLTQSSTSTTTTSSRIPDPQRLIEQRWRHFSDQIASKQLSRKSVVALNRALDEAEESLARDAPRILAYGKAQESGLGIEEIVFERKAMRGGAMTPPNSMILHAPRPKDEGEIEQMHGKGVDSMLARVTNLVGELRSRHEEFRHLHSVAIAKAEQYTERVVQLVANVEQLEEDVMDDQSELTYLKLGLRILEVQALPSVPPREKDSLTEGIQRWRSDWADVSNRFRMRRRKRDPGKETQRNLKISPLVDSLEVFPPYV